MRMTHWNYRVTVRFNAVGEPEYDIREVYYDDEKIVGWTALACAPGGDTKNELAKDILNMTEAFDRPVIDITDEKKAKEIS